MKVMLDLNDIPPEARIPTMVQTIQSGGMTADVMKAWAEACKDNNVQAQEVLDVLGRLNYFQASHFSSQKVAEVVSLLSWPFQRNVHFWQTLYAFLSALTHVPPAALRVWLINVPSAGVSLPAHVVAGLRDKVCESQDEACDEAWDELERCITVYGHAA